jgi:glycosyltransferase involved in cell wall biosynthesis
LLYVPRYFPDYVGSGERLVQLTAAGLRALEVPVAIAADTRGGASYRFDDVDVIGVPHAVRGLHWTEHEPDAAAFAALLQRLRPSHVHTISLSGLGVVGEVAKAHGARLGLAAMEYGLVCARRTLVRGNGELCAGPRALDDCFACTLEDRPRRDRVLGHVGRYLPEPLATTMTNVAHGLAGRPMGMQLHASRDMRRRDDARRRALARLDLLVATTRFTHGVFSPHVDAHTHLAALMYPLDHALLGPEPKCTPGDVLRVGFVGRALPIKGLDVLIAAVERLRPRVPVELHVHCPRNDGEHAELARALERRVQALDGSRWHWRGVLDAPALRELHAQIDVLAVPSVWPEWLGFVTLEAQGLGTPLVLSDLASQRELADGDRRSSWFVRPGDAEALASCLAEVWERKRDGTLSAPRVVAPTARDYAAELLRLYAERAPS